MCTPISLAAAIDRCERLCGFITDLEMQIDYFADQFHKELRLISKSNKGERQRLKDLFVSTGHVTAQALDYHE